MPPPTPSPHPPRSDPHTGRALAEAFGAGVLMIVTFMAMNGFGSDLGHKEVLLLGMIALALFVVRRSYPVLSVLGLAALMAVLPAVGLVTAIAAYTTTQQLVAPRRRIALLLSATALAMLTCFTLAPRLAIGSQLFGLALGAVLAATTVIVPGLVGTSAGQQGRLLQALRERTAAAEQAQRLADSESRIHERSRIAAEMHDLVGHRLSLISLHAGGLEMALQKESPELREEAALVRVATKDAMNELREVLGVLGPLGRDTGTDTLTDATGTRADIEALVEESRRGGIPVDFDWDGPDLDIREARVRRAVHRVVRESLTNVHRYAAGAHVTVAVTHTDEHVGIRVRNGLPPTPPAATTGLGSGRGLTGLRERVTLLGGFLEAGATPSGGFLVEAAIPADPGPGPGASDETARADWVQDPAGGQRRSLSAVQRRVAGGISGLLGLAGIGAMMLFGMLLVDQAKPGPDYRPPDPPKIGDSRSQVTAAVYGDNELSRAAAQGREPARPKDATSCIYPFAGHGEVLPDQGDIELSRYCFRDNTLISIDHFKVPLVTEPTTDPTPSPGSTP
ncbi:sensor histidine kinase [Streptomyces sp. NBC_01304]|uniref:sensor histidine kinase n=1 Tax=Streptomyces sp. NBC_01304 TaxID=2903818 RepID=UPI002E148EF4|nr:histidine kinase [Streptomyces sp. NBC_01304]